MASHLSLFLHSPDRRRVQRGQEQSQAGPATSQSQLRAPGQYRERQLHIPVCLDPVDSPVLLASVDSHLWPSYLIEGDLCFLCICDRSYPRKLAFTYLSDLSREFTTTYQPAQYLSPTCRPYAFVDFDTFIQRTKKTYQDSRATQNLDKLNDELKDVTKVMTKNIEDLLYRGDSLERMGDMSSRLREDSRKYKKAAVRINWELLLKQYGPVGGLAFVMIVFIWWRFF